MRTHHRRGYGLVGLLIAVAIMVVLATVMMNGLNKAVTGGGNPEAGTVRSFEDKLKLQSIMQGLIVYAMDNRDRYPVPSEFSRSNDIGENTTASFFSLMVGQRYAVCENLISGNEYSGYVWEYTEYDYGAYDPSSGSFWDPGFQADLHDLSHTSFAHMALSGDRLDRKWEKSFDSTFPLIGNRGPIDGVTDPNSMTHGRDGTWGGHLAFGDGHVEWIESPLRPQLRVSVDGLEGPDNIFVMEEGPFGADAIISFTETMDRDGPTLIWD
ncbi:MAG: type II secretion system protein [Planctomycetota bacterium]|jgi:hypothetical protein